VIADEGLPSPAMLCAALRDRGIEGRPLWKPVHLQAPYADVPRAASLAESDRLWRRILTLPSSTNLSAGQQRRVIDAMCEPLHDPVRCGADGGRNEMGGA
jgi:perosamine synthetase